jgi:hypothetical protein
MKVALVGWEIDESIAASLACLGLDVVAFTRWHEGLPYRQGCGGWLMERCPHRIGEGLAGEASSFRDSVLSRDATYGVGSGGYDVVHALDRFSEPAALGLAGRNVATLRVASLREDEPADRHWDDVDCWIADHPVRADQWIGREPVLAQRTRIVPMLSALRGDEGGPIAAGRDGTLVGVWVARRDVLDVDAVAAEMLRLRERSPDASVVVLGAAGEAESLRRKLAVRNLLTRMNHGAAALTAARWTSTVGACRVLVVAGPDPAGDPASLCAWMLNVPVLAAGGRGVQPLSEAILDLIHTRTRTDRMIRAGMALARRRLEPDGVAASWLGVYLSMSLATSADTDRPMRPVLPIADRSRLHIVPVSSREAFASWHVRPEDWTRAVEWLGPDASGAALVLRLQNITALEFHGRNAHESWDVPLAYGERQRRLWFDRSGLSLAVALGVASPRGAFLEIARAGLVHLPSEEPSRHAPTQRLGALPRRSS